MADLMTNKQLNIWGRDFDLPVVFQNFSDEPISNLERETAQKLGVSDFNTAKHHLTEFILKHNKEELGASKIDNIFKYVIPKSIIICNNKHNRLFALMCNYRFDMEHGLAIVFENESYKAVGYQDIIL
ncbi:MAG: hypothetical protein IJ746_04440 [Ruminococcus sp.]|nr:hypothetical protein [Ruminococcus sp.]